jgi:hypothetical protein
VRYSAATCTRAARPITITIGRASTRRGWRVVSRWWIRHARTWHLAPLSVPQMMALQAVAGDPLAYVVTLVEALRTAVPRRWWHRVVGDPVRLLLQLPPDLVPVVLRAMVSAPSGDDVSTQPHDATEEIRRAQRMAVHGKDAPRGGISLAMAALSVRAVYGDAWYYAPDRWPTTDGYVPFSVALVEYAGVQALDARRRLEIADGTGMAQAKDGARVRRQMEALAYPAEVC